MATKIKMRDKKNDNNKTKQNKKTNLESRCGIISESKYFILKKLYVASGNCMKITLTDINAKIVPKNRPYWVFLTTVSQVAIWG